MLDIIISILSLFGICWIILFVMLITLGGSLKVTINNPLTNQVDILTNINTIKDIRD